MRIAVFGINYHPELTGPAPFTTERSEYWARRGHKVTVITTFPFYPFWKVLDNYKRKLFSEEKLNKVRILRCFAYVPKNQNTIKRIMHEISFTIASFIRVLFLEKHDVVFYTCPPLTLGISAYLFSKLKKALFIIHIQDLLPDAAVSVGMLRNRHVIKMVDNLAAFLYKRADAIIIISHGFLDNIRRKRIPKSKIYYLPDWVDTDFIRPLDRNNRFRKKYGIKTEQFVVMYSGNIGFKQGLEIILEAADKLKKYKKILFCLVGEGARKQALLRRTKQMKLSNIRFFTLQPVSMLPMMLSAADILVITQRTEVRDICIPCKLLSYMSSGSPIIAAVNPHSETAHVLHEANSGLILEPENGESLAEGILKLYQDSHLRESLGKNGRQYVVKKFDKKKMLTKYNKFLLNIYKEKTLGSPHSLDKK